jgi:hypothetical protein
MTEETPNPHPKRKHRVTDAEIIKALEETRGNITAAARVLQVDRPHLHIRIHKYPNLKAKLDEQREVRVDYAESALDIGIKNGEAWAVLWTLRTLGRARGYVETSRHEHTGKDGEAIEIKGFNYANAIANIAPRPMADSDTLSANQSRSDGQTLGQDVDGEQS